MRQLKLIIAALLVFGPFAANSTPVLFALDDTTNLIFMIDPSTGAVSGSYAAPSVFGLVAGLTIAEEGAALLFTNGTSNPLWRLDPATGAVLNTFNHGSSNSGGLSFESGSPNSIYIVNDGNPLQLQAGYGGSTTAFGPSGHVFPGALGGDDNGRLFGIFGTSISEFDLTSGALINQFLRPGGPLAGLAFDGVNLYASEFGGSGLIYTLDPNSGAILNQVSVAGNWVGLAVTAFSVPEPGTLALLGIGLFGLGLARRRKTI